MKQHPNPHSTHTKTNTTLVMSQKALKLLTSSLLNSKPKPSFVTKSQQKSTTNPITTHTQTLKIPSRLLTTTSSSTNDPLEGLIDPNDPFCNNPSNPDSVSAEEFDFLKSSLFDSKTPSGSYSEVANKCSNDAVLIVNFIRNSGDDNFGFKTERYLRQFREKLTESLVVDVLKNVGNREFGVKFFLWAGRQIGYTHSNAVYVGLLELIGGNDGGLEEWLLREIGRDDREVLGVLLNVLVKKCCKHGWWNLALEELGRLKDYGYKPTRSTYNALVRVFLEADRLDTAGLVHREMEDLGYGMDRYTLGYFTHSLCKAGRWREAMKLIEKEEIVPDTVLYTQMISGLCEASLFEEAMDLLNIMRSDSCLPNVVTYRILLCGCLKKRQLGRCKRVLSMMMTEGCYPSPRIFNSLVHAHCSSGDYSYAYKLLNKMVICGCKPGYVVYNILIGGICGKDELPNADTLELAEKAYSEMLNAGSVLNKVNVANFARCLCGAGNFEKAYSVIGEMMRKGFIPDPSTYSKVMGFLCDASKVEKAFLLFKEMKRNGVIPDVYTYTILIDNFCKAGLIDQARTWLDDMIREGCTPNVVTFTALIHAHLKANKISSANELFEMMLSLGCIPNIVTHTALIDGHCKAGKVEKACQIYARMRGSLQSLDVNIYFSIGSGDTEKPNIFTYGALVDGLCKSHKVKEARDLLDAMSKEGCLPNHIVYDALIDGFCKVGKLEEAQEVFTKMSECGYRPSVYTYSSLIDRLFKDGRLDLALKVLSQMLENSYAPNVVIYTEMIDGLCKVGKTDEAYKLLLMMQEKGCSPNVVTYTAMIDGFGKDGKIEKCLELFRHMSSKGCAPNFVTYSVLIKHCCAVGLLDEAYELLDEMKHTYWPRHIGVYRKVIEGFNREFLVSLGLLEEMTEDSSVPVAPLYKILIDNFAKAGKLDVALTLHEEIVSCSPFSTSVHDSYISLINSFSHANKAEKALELYADMTKRGGVPELSTFVHLIKGLTRINKWEEAIQLSDSISRMDIHWLQEKELSDETRPTPS